VHTSCVPVASLYYQLFTPPQLYCDSDSAQAVILPKLSEQNALNTL